MKLLTFPNFKNPDHEKAYNRLIIGILITIGGDWFVQIAVISSLLHSWESNSPIALYFLCLFFPKILSPLIWKKLVSALGLKPLLVFSQILGLFSSLGQIISLTIINHELFYLSTFAKGLASTFVFLGYDTAVVARIQDTNEIKAANSIMAMIRYGGITIFPWLGSLSAHYIGNIPTIVVDSLSFMIAAIVFSGVSSSFLQAKRYSEEETEDKEEQSSQSVYNFLFDVTVFTVFLNQIAYSVFNWYLPIHVLKEQGVSKIAYGILMMVCGVAFIVTGRAVATIKKVSLEKRIFTWISISTVLNGMALYVGLSTPSFFVTLPFIVLASVASMVSIILLKTTILKKNGASSSEIASYYNGVEWTGTTVGFLGCAVFGSRLLASHMLTAMLLLMLTGPLLILMMRIFRKKELCMENA